MEPHIQRVVQELEPLLEKQQRLAIFLSTDTFKLLDEYEQRLLKLQHYHMLSYSAILQLRVQIHEPGVKIE